MARFSVTTLGCKVNQYDGAAIAQALRDSGLEPPPAGSPPAVAVVNTCCVTAAAMAKSRRAIRQAVRRNPGAAILVTGCYADYDPRGLTALLSRLGVGPQQAVVAGHHDQVGRHVARLATPLTGVACPGGPCGRRPDAELRPHVGDDRSMSARGPTAGADGDHTSIKARRQAAVKQNHPGARDLPAIGRFPGRQRAVLKVQDGCDAFCAYCVVPYTRSVMWWRPAQQVLAEARRLIRAGHKEIVLAGVFLGAYGRPTAIRRRWAEGASPLPELLRRVGELEGLWRVRLSSLEPGDLTEELLEAYRRTPTAAWHFHLPLQSGSGPVLRRMNRQYTPEGYRRAVERIRAADEKAAITTDIIVGFPGEREEDFARTMELARWAGFSKIHAFPFSAIRGTAAWTYRRQAPPPAVVKRRMAELAALERELAVAYRRRFVGTTMEALVESSRRGAFRRAMTDRYLKVYFASGAPSSGQIVELRITGLHGEGLSGEPARASDL